MAKRTAKKSNAIVITEENIIASWGEQVDLDLSARELVTARTIGTLTFMSENDIARSQVTTNDYDVIIDYFITKDWPVYAEKTGKHEKGSPVGVKNAIESGCVSAVRWDCCRKQLAKYEFCKSTGLPVKDSKGFVLKESTPAENNPSRKVSEIAKQVGEGIDQVRSAFGGQELSEEVVMAINIMIKAINAGNNTITAKKSTKRTVKKNVEGSGIVKITETVEESADMKAFREFQEFKAMQANG